MGLIDRVARCTIDVENLNRFITHSQLQETLQDFRPLVEQCTTFLQRYRNESVKGQSEAQFGLETQFNPMQGHSIKRLFSSKERDSLQALEASFDQFQQQLNRGMAVQTSITTSKLEVMNNQIAKDGMRLCYILIY